MVNPALPFVGMAINAWAQKLQFVLVGKRQEDFETVECLIPKVAYGVRAPLRPQALMMKPEGERAWKWEEIHASPSLQLDPDDVVIFDGIRYRVMAKQDFSEYGYIRYEILQDYNTCS